MKYVQYTNFNIPWYYRKFPRRPFSDEKYKKRGINTILLYYNYRVDPKLGKGVCVIHQITYAACVS